MRLLVTTPTQVVVDEGEVLSVRAEDETGALGILPGHTNFLTMLAVSVLSWRRADGRERHVALRGGVLSVRAGRLVEVATPEAVAGEDLRALEDNVLAAFRQEVEDEREARQATQRLQLVAIRQLHCYLHPHLAVGPHRAAASARSNGNGRRAP